ncbi:hypothetical protein Tco_0515515, partial [Tanacetum coccineum]
MRLIDGLGTSGNLIVEIDQTMLQLKISIDFRNYNCAIVQLSAIGTTGAGFSISTKASGA